MQDEEEEWLDLLGVSTDDSLSAVTEQSSRQSAGDEAAAHRILDTPLLARRQWTSYTTGARRAVKLLRRSHVPAVLVSTCTRAVVGHIAAPLPWVLLTRAVADHHQLVTLGACATACVLACLTVWGGVREESVRVR